MPGFARKYQKFIRLVVIYLTRESPFFGVSKDNPSKACSLDWVVIQGMSCCIMTFGTTTEVLAERMLKYCRILKCAAASMLYASDCRGRPHGLMADDSDWVQASGISLLLSGLDEAPMMMAPMMMMMMMVALNTFKQKPG